MNASWFRIFRPAACHLAFAALIFCFFGGSSLSSMLIRWTDVDSTSPPSLFCFSVLKVYRFINFCRFKKWLLANYYRKASEISCWLPKNAEPVETRVLLTCWLVNFDHEFTVLCFSNTSNKYIPNWWMKGLLPERIQISKLINFFLLHTHQVHSNMRHQKV